MGIRKDIKKYIKRLEDMSRMPWEEVYINDVVQNLKEILRKSKKEKAQKRLKNEYIAVKESGLNDDGDTFKARRVWTAEDGI